MKPLPYWIIILSLFGTSMWAVQTREYVVEEKSSPFYTTGGSIEINSVPLKSWYSPETKDFIGYCSDEVYRVSLPIYLPSELPGNLEGQFHSESTGKIFLVVKKNSDYQNVVPHEVSHFTDYLIDLLVLSDKETRAYIQGYFTDCVTDLIKSRTQPRTIKLISQ